MQTNEHVGKEEGLSWPGEQLLPLRASSPLSPSWEEEEREAHFGS